MRNLEYDNDGNLSIVRTNLMNEENCSGYCGNSWDEQKKKGCDAWIRKKRKKFANEVMDLFESINKPTDIKI